MEKKITLKEFLFLLHFISYQHGREICTFLNLTELLTSNRIKETYSYSHIVLISILALLNSSLKSNICADSLRCLILQCSSLSIIITLFHKGRQFPFSFHIWSVIPNLYISPHITAFQYSLSLFLVSSVSCLCLFCHHHK